jgi:hypothetical protein
MRYIKEVQQQACSAIASVPSSNTTRASFSIFIPFLLRDVPGAAGAYSRWLPAKKMTINRHISHLVARNYNTWPRSVKREITPFLNLFSRASYPHIIVGIFSQPPGWPT